MAWSMWQMVEVCAHHDFGEERPTFEELTAWLGDRFVMRTDDSSLHVLTTLIHSGWEIFKNLAEPDEVR